ncbi:MAG: SusC/RagA family TonB-linked outer membrane protein, partial [Chitinophagaceae bacterium]|nr:SusC/RagA family TonB-linked outer membrane protein [Chitinophagaceae bacterium]
VTALGISKQKRQLGFSITEVKGDVLAKTNEVNPVNALQGRIAGVQIDQGAGGLFGNSKIIIRGNSTLGKNNQPIFVIDGVIMDNDIFEGTGRDFGNDLKNLNMDNFETVSILKGSAAAALYGTRAINGVVLITTKKGSARKGIGVTVNHSISFTKPYSGPKFQNEYGGGSVGAFFTDNRDANYPTDNWTTKVFPIDPATGKPYIDRQIFRELENWGPRMEGQEVINYDGTTTKYLPQPNNFLDAFQTGKGNNTNIAIDGGTEKSTFRLAYNHNDAEGVVRNNKLAKDAFDFRATHNFNNSINVDASLAYTNFNGKNPPRLGGLDAFGSFNLGHMYTWVLPRNYDTKYWMQKDKYTSILGGVPDPNNPNEPNKVPEARFWFLLYNNNYIQNEQLVRGRIAITAKLTNWAKLILEGNFNNIYTKSESTELGQGINFSGGAYSLGFNTKQTNLLKAILMLNRDINKDFSVNGYIGAESQRNKDDYEISSTEGGLNYPGGFFLTNSVNPLTVNGGVLSRKNFNSLYASADMAYKNMLFLQGTWRGDWSSALTYTDGSGNNFYNYPAVSLSWIFTESFKNLPSWISFGKLRGNIAALGGDTDPFNLNPGYAFNGFTFANGGNAPTSTYNSNSVLQANIKPVRKISKEVGLEMRFLQSRLGFDLSIYQDNTKNQILNIGTPPESGVGSILINAGNIQNKGIELAIDATPVRTKNFTWNTSLNYSRNRNLIVDLYTGRTEFDLGANIAEISTWAVVGKSYGTLRTQIHSTAFQAKDASGNNTADPRNGKPILSWRSDARAAFPKRSNEWQDVGDINAKFRGGWNNTFSFKNFTLNVLIDAKIGGDFVMASYRFGTHTGALYNTLNGRDASHGGISWTSKYNNIAYDDGLIPDGVFADGQTITQPDGTSVDVSGLTYQEAYDKGYVEPTHAPQFYYRYGSSSTGVADYWIKKNSWISLRQVAVSYNFPKKIYEKAKLNGLSLSATGRDLVYLYNTLPLNFNPASNNSNNTAYSGENGFLPMMRSIMFTVRASF